VYRHEPWIDAALLKKLAAPSLVRCFSLEAEKCRNGDGDGEMAPIKLRLKLPVQSSCLVERLPLEVNELLHDFLPLCHSRSQLLLERTSLECRSDCHKLLAPQAESS
jgi:hypothetical protein